MLHEKFFRPDPCSVRRGLAEPMDTGRTPSWITYPTVPGKACPLAMIPEHGWVFRHRQVQALRDAVPTTSPQGCR